MCKLKPLLSRWLDEADNAQGQLPQVGGDKNSQQVWYLNLLWRYTDTNLYYNSHFKISVQICENVKYVLLDYFYDVLIMLFFSNSTDYCNFSASENNQHRFFFDTHCA